MINAREIVKNLQGARAQIREARESELNRQIKLMTSAARTYDDAYNELSGRNASNRVLAQIGYSAVSLYGQMGMELQASTRANDILSRFQDQYTPDTVTELERIADYYPRAA